jgi:hypothetical protein
MSELRNEILLRLLKAVAAALVGLVIYLLATGPFGVPSSFEVVALSWISGAVAILLTESSPI